MLLLLKSDARWPESQPKSSFTARAPALTGKPACKLSYPSFVQPGPGGSEKAGEQQCSNKLLL